MDAIIGFFQYFTTYWQKLAVALEQHLAIVGWTLLFAIPLAALLTVATVRFPRFSEFLVGLLGVVYSIPSLALFALMIPVTGLGLPTAVIVLVFYNQFILLRNFLAGLRSVDKGILEAALGMGMNRSQMFLRIQLPLAFPVIMAGIHLAVISTIGIATIAATINAGGLGTILFDGLRTQNVYKIIWGCVFSGGLALIANFALAAVEKQVNKRLGPPPGPRVLTRR